jgi:hypothetical protein
MRAARDETYRWMCHLVLRIPSIFTRAPRQAGIIPSVPSDDRAALFGFQRTAAVSPKLRFLDVGERREPAPHLEELSTVAGQRAYDDRGTLPKWPFGRFTIGMA